MTLLCFQYKLMIKNQIKNDAFLSIIAEWNEKASWCPSKSNCPLAIVQRASQRHSLSGGGAVCVCRVGWLHWAHPLSPAHALWMGGGMGWWKAGESQLRLCDSHLPLSAQLVWMVYNAWIMMAYDETILVHYLKRIVSVSICSWL